MRRFNVEPVDLTGGSFAVEGSARPEGHARGGGDVTRVDPRSVIAAEYDGGYGPDVISGSADHDYIRGWEGDDYLRGQFGDDILMGGDGDDTLVGGDGSDRLFGGYGVDTVSFEGETSGVYVRMDYHWASVSVPGGSDNFYSVENVTGTAFIDTLIGDYYSNVLTGLNGNDQLLGSSGDDTLIGGEGSDYLSGGSDDDVLNGGAGNDSLDGGSDDDILHGGAGNDSLNGGYGQDTVDFSDSSDGVAIDLYSGTATHTGGEQDTMASIEVVIGTDFADSFSGDSSANTFYGDGGDDQIQAGQGDTVFGGEGDDTITLSVGTALADAGAGSDTLLLPSIPYAGAAIDLAAGTVTLGWHPTITAIGFENVTGTDYNDNIWGSSAANVIHGGFGYDTIRGQGGDDVIFGESEDNWLYGGEGDDRLYGGTDEDTLRGGAGNDLLVGGAGWNYMFGDDGDDTFQISNSSTNEITGGSGSDTISFSGLGIGVTITLATTDQQWGGPPFFSLSILSSVENLVGTSLADNLTGDGAANVIEGGAGNDVLNGAGGVDTASYASAGSGVVADLTIVTSQNTGGAGSDTLSGFENLRGSAFNDALSGDTGANVLTGGGGDDVLNGRKGADTMAGGLGNDLIYVDNAGDLVIELAGEGTADRVISKVDYVLAAGVEVEILSAAFGQTTNTNLWANEFNQTVHGNAGDNGLYGMGGADVIYGFGGADVLFGGDGADILFGGVGADETRGGAGDDDHHLDDIGDLALEEVGEGTRDRVFTSVDHVLAAGSEVEVLLAAEPGGVSALDLTGNEFGQTLKGNDGINELDGGAGNDIIQGRSGADTLVGGEGNDILEGGAGVDLFDFRAGSFGNDVIKDFANGSELIYLRAATGVDDFSDLTLSTNGKGQAVITLPDGSTITLKGLVEADVDASDFIFDGPI